MGAWDGEGIKSHGALLSDVEGRCAFSKLDSGAVSARYHPRQGSGGKAQPADKSPGPIPAHPTASVIAKSINLASLRTRMSLGDIPHMDHREFERSKDATYSTERAMRRR